MFENDNDPDLEGLAEIRLPEPVSYTPQTSGWWIFGVIVVLVLIGVAFRAWRWRQRDAYRRRALRRLDELEARAEDPTRRAEALAEIPVLVKRAALDAWPRERVSDLSGRAWLAFLDDTYGGDGFTNGPGHHLPALAYAEPDVGAEDAEGLFETVRSWILEHRA